MGESQRRGKITAPLVKAGGANVRSEFSVVGQFAINGGHPEEPDTRVRFLAWDEPSKSAVILSGAEAERRAQRSRRTPAAPRSGLRTRGRTGSFDSVPVAELPALRSG